MVSLSGRVSRAWWTIGSRSPPARSNTAREIRGSCPAAVAGENSAHRNAHDADLPRIDFRPRGQHVERAADVLDSLGQGLAKSRGSAARA